MRGAALLLALATGLAALADEPRVFDVRDYGAKGDGRTADSEAVQRAIDAAAACNGTVRFPAGRYMVHDLKAKPGISLSAEPKWLFRPESVGAVLQLDDPGARCVLDITGAYGVRVSGLLLNGDRGVYVDWRKSAAEVTNRVHGILFDNPEKWSPKEDSPVIEDVKVQNFTGDGLRLNRIWCFFIRHSMFGFNLGNGVTLRGWDGFVIDNQFSGNAGDGFGCLDHASTVMFTSNRIEWNGRYGLHVAPKWGNSWNVTGNAFDRNGWANLNLERIQGSSVTGNLFRRAGTSRTDLPKPTAHPVCQARVVDCRGVTVVGNTAEAGQDDEGCGTFTPDVGFALGSLEACVVKGNTLFHGYLKEAVSDAGNHTCGTVIAENPAKPLPLPKGEDVR